MVCRRMGDGDGLDKLLQWLVSGDPFTPAPHIPTSHTPPRED